MDITQQFRRNVRTFYAWVGSVALLGLSPMLALWMIDRGAMGWRIAAVVVGAGGALPWMWVLYRIVRQGDEFVRRMHLIAIAFAAAATLAVLMTMDWLQRAEIIDSPNMALVWPGCLVIWLVALVGTKRHFERPE